MSATYLFFAKSFFAKISQMEFLFGLSFVAKESVFFAKSPNAYSFFANKKMLLFRQTVSDYGTCGFPNGPNRCVPNPRYGHDGGPSLVLRVRKLKISIWRINYHLAIND